MSYNSKYTGAEIDRLLDQIKNGNSGNPEGVVQEIAHITIDSDISDDFVSFTLEECEQIIEAYYTNKIIFISGSSTTYRRGYCLLNIDIIEITDSSYKMYMSYTCGTVYTAVDVSYDRGSSTATTTIKKQIDIALMGSKIEIEDTSLILEDNILPNNVYCIPKTVTGISVECPEDDYPGDVVKEYTIHFFTGDEVYPFQFSDNLLWANGKPPIIEANTAYELSIVATSIRNYYVYKGVLTSFPKKVN